MESILKEIGLIAKEHLAGLGLNVTGLHYYIPQRAQAKRKGICISFDALTKEPECFGQTFEIPKRQAPTKLLYKTLGPQLPELFPGREVLLDVYVRLEDHIMPRGSCPPAPIAPDTKVYDVSYVPLATLIRKGEVEIDSTLYHYCQKYSIPHVMFQGPHCTSPDNSSVEALEAINYERRVESVLEIGGGVGICGVAAEMARIKDYTFVDISATACRYLQDRFPRYRVIHQSAFDFNFDRQWDLILVGMGYQLNPWFLERRGMDLADHCSIVVFQSGITAFYEFEHDWICGKPGLVSWPWWNVFQTLRPYFPHIWESAFDWQTCAFGAHENVDIATLQECMRQRGFSEIQYQRITL